jgi:hypothetical protein
MSDVGKRAKMWGAQHPRDLRRLDQVPEKATPAKSTHKVEKPFGYEYQWNSLLWKTKVHVRRQWFKTKAGRDQSMAKRLKEIYNGRPFYINIKPIDP